MKNELQRLIETEYDLGIIESITPIKEGVSNLNYKVITDKGIYVARICRYEPENQLNVMLPFLKYAEENGLPAPHLIATRDKKHHTELQDSPVIITSFIAGRTLNITELNDDHIKSLAENVAKLHNLDWSPKTNSSTLSPSFILDIYDQWKDKSFQTNTGAPDNFGQMLQEDYLLFSSDDFKQKFNSLPKITVHGDLIPGNVMFGDNNSVTAFVDLEEIGKETRLLDLARILTTWFFHENNFDTSKVKTFMDKYLSISPLDSKEQEMLETIIHYITFRHAVFIFRMVLQGRLERLEDNQEIAAYIKVRDENYKVFDISRL